MGDYCCLSNGKRWNPAMYWIGWRWGSGRTWNSAWWLLCPLTFRLAVPEISYMCCTWPGGLFLQVPACFYSEYCRFVFLCVSYRIIHGVGRPDEVLECIERGVDIFESFFPFQVTERGCALVFSYDCHPDPEATGRLLDGLYRFYILHNSYLGGICIWGLCSQNKCSDHWKNWDSTTECWFWRWSTLVWNLLSKTWGLWMSH